MSATPERSGSLPGASPTLEPAAAEHASLDSAPRSPRSSKRGRSSGEHRVTLHRIGFAPPMRRKRSSSSAARSTRSLDHNHGSAVRRPRTADESEPAPNGSLSVMSDGGHGMRDDDAPAPLVVVSADSAAEHAPASNGVEARDQAALSPSAERALTPDGAEYDSAALTPSRDVLSPILSVGSASSPDDTPLARQLSLPAHTPSPPPLPPKSPRHFRGALQMLAERDDMPSPDVPRTPLPADSASASPETSTRPLRPSEESRLSAIEGIRARAATWSTSRGGRPVSSPNLHSPLTRPVRLTRRRTSDTEKDAVSESFHEALRREARMQRLAADDAGAAPPVPDKQDLPSRSSEGGLGLVRSSSATSHDTVRAPSKRDAPWMIDGHLFEHSPGGGKQSVMSQPLAQSRDKQRASDYAAEGPPPRSEELDMPESGSKRGSAGANGSVRSKLSKWSRNGKRAHSRDESQSSSAIAPPSEAERRPSGEDNITLDEDGDEIVEAPAGAYAIQPPSRASLAIAAELNVLNEAGEMVRFGDLFEQRRTIFCFLRHWLCPFCQMFTESLQLLDPLPLERAELNLVVIGQGHWHVTRAYKEVMNVPAWIQMYADPTRKIYKALGMTLRTNDAGPACTRPEYQTRGALKGTLIAMKRGVFDMPLRMPGDLKLLGGEFILGPGLQCSFTHRMVTVRGHLDLKRVLVQAGCDLSLKTPRNVLDDGAVTGRPASTKSLGRKVKSKRFGRKSKQPAMPGADEQGATSSLASAFQSQSMSRATALDRSQSSARNALPAASANGSAPPRDTRMSHQSARTFDYANTADSAPREFRGSSMDASYSSQTRSVQGAPSPALAAAVTSLKAAPFVRPPLPPLPDGAEDSARTMSPALTIRSNASMPTFLDRRFGGITSADSAPARSTATPSMDSERPVSRASTSAGITASSEMRSVASAGGSSSGGWNGTALGPRPRTAEPTLVRSTDSALTAMAAATPVPVTPTPLDSAIAATSRSPALHSTSSSTSLSSASGAPRKTAGIPLSVFEKRIQSKASGENVGLASPRQTAFSNAPAALLKTPTGKNTSAFDTPTFGGSQSFETSRSRTLSEASAASNDPRAHIENGSAPDTGVRVESSATGTFYSGSGATTPSELTSDSESDLSDEEQPAAAPPVAAVAQAPVSSRGTSSGTPSQPASRSESRNSMRRGVGGSFLDDLEDVDGFGHRHVDSMQRPPSMGDLIYEDDDSDDGRWAPPVGHDPDAALSDSYDEEAARRTRWDRDSVQSSVGGASRSSTLSMSSSAQRYSNGSLSGPVANSQVAPGEFDSTFGGRPATPPDGEREDQVQSRASTASYDSYDSELDGTSSSDDEFELRSAARTPLSPSTSDGSGRSPGGTWRTPPHRQYKSSSFGRLPRRLSAFVEEEEEEETVNASAPDVDADDSAPVDAVADSETEGGYVTGRDSLTIDDAERSALHKSGGAASPSAMHDEPPTPSEDGEALTPIARPVQLPAQEA